MQCCPARSRGTVYSVKVRNNEIRSCNLRNLDTVLCSTLDFDHGTTARREAVRTSRFRNGSERGLGVGKEREHGRVPKVSKGRMGQKEIGVLDVDDPDH